MFGVGKRKKIPSSKLQDAADLVVVKPRREGNNQPSYSIVHRIDSGSPSVGRNNFPTGNGSNFPNVPFVRQPDTVLTNISTANVIANIWSKANNIPKQDVQDFIDRCKRIRKQDSYTHRGNTKKHKSWTGSMDWINGFNFPGAPQPVLFMGNVMSVASATTAIDRMLVGTSDSTILGIHLLAEYIIFHYYPGDTINIGMSQPGSFTTSPKYLNAVNVKYFHYQDDILRKQQTCIQHPNKQERN
ncbi:hypothetical protein DAPPUDRAFT_250856 [Daphnia pulex]|uniref:Uncharacterized protein n=1 Tax=Daphnia pulex TaxID=6669 RepID=E9GZD8_DAPPU|nr:hypothetical protein DAPPUDRAFT_250856 [Daphnia pulex]|eukprot:EFX75177.1 hypothetical protein DAPPUDRAFT_250856 [Daphnia pulex]